MKIGIYNESSRPSHALGGSESYAMAIADALTPEHEVEFIHHRPDLTLDTLAAIAGVAVPQVALRLVPLDDAADDTGSSVTNPARRYRQARAWQSEVSRPYDLFINVVHRMPPFCHAPRGVLAVLFPFFDPFYIWPDRPATTLDANLPHKRLARHYHLWEWKQRMDSYALKTSISGFTRHWLQRRWGVESEVIYPPASKAAAGGDKHNAILSVGRFAANGVIKHQFDLAQTFRSAVRRALPDWTFHCAGGVGMAPEDQAYVENVRLLGADSGVTIATDLDREGLLSSYGRAKIFWHAAGYAAAETLYPQCVEHFGIVTVEAMAHGCVPVVVNKGGQAEIVQHGVNGFLWNTLDELAEYTLLLARNEPLRRHMAEAARQRAQYFSRKEFKQRWTQFLQPLLR